MTFKNIGIPVVLLWVCIAGSCVPEEKPDMERIHKEVNDRIQKYKAFKRKKCIDGIVKEVEAAVDSALLKEAMLRQSKVIPIPDPGERPERPDVSFPEFKSLGK